jgi:plasmid stabilization system protein ParE
MRLLYRRDAAADVAAAHAWYEAQRQGLGDEFLESLRHAEEAVLASPCTYRVIHRDTRRFLLRRFPYQLLYRVADEIVVVVACFHVRRSAGGAKARR